MSFEGYYQVVCKNGHYHTMDAYSPDDGMGCPFCGAPKAWENVVDETNGSFDDGGNRIDGFVFLRAKRDAKTCICDKCGHEHEVEPAIFEIPDKS
jgi:transcription elongation factor Elf1